MDVSKLLSAMRADLVPVGSSGRWQVEKISVSQRQSMLTLASDGVFVPPAEYTALTCYTTETMMQKRGELVMNDFPSELQKHLEFIMRASGRVLVGGLGLGCVVRGLLARGRVESIDLIERSEDVICLCGPSVSDPRVTIQKADAVNGFVKGGPWDFAWWDLWSDPEKSEPHLQISHVSLIARFEERVRFRQGAWAMPRRFRRSLREAGVML